MVQQKRIHRHKYFMEIAKLAAQRGTCPRAQVGCVLVGLDNRIKATGYNSSHPGSPHCSRSGCIIINDHCIRTLHAEVAAVLNLEMRYDNLIAYITHQACIDCYKILTAAGVQQIVFWERYGNDFGEFNNLRKEIGVNPWCLQDLHDEGHIIENR